MPADPTPSTPPMLGGLEGALPEAERAGFARLRQAWHARLRPVDEAERATVDGLVAQVWRARRLDLIEERVMAELARLRPVPAQIAPSLLLRARTRLDKDRQAILEELELARLARPKPLPMPDLNPERLEWLARLVRRKGAQAEAAGLAAGAATLDPDPVEPPAPSRPAVAEPPPPAAAGEAGPPAGPAPASAPPAPAADAAPIERPGDRAPPATAGRGPCPGGLPRAPFPATAAAAPPPAA